MESTQPEVNAANQDPKTEKMEKNTLAEDKTEVSANQEENNSGDETQFTTKDEEEAKT